jgi:DNA-binding NarL/FixJ family response regulator
MTNLPDRIRILVVDDHPLLREGIVSLVEKQSDMLIVAEASSGKEARHLFEQCLPDITLMDLRLPDIDGIDAMMSILAQFPHARIIMLTTFSGR